MTSLLNAARRSLPLPFAFTALPREFEAMALAEEPGTDLRCAAQKNATCSKEAELRRAGGAR